MNRAELFRLIQKKRSFLCVGLDTDLKRIPSFLYKEKDPVFAFNRQIVDATLPYAVAYKPNLAFYESLGAEGWDSLRKTVEYIRSKNEPVFLIADAKRGDISNTSAMYARTFFETLDFDAVTLSPYMGFDTVAPFLKYANKWSVILGLTSNESAQDFQYFEESSGEHLYEKVLRTAKHWGSSEQIMFVVGATKPEAFRSIRNIVPDHFLLVPGIGTQGGSLKAVAQYGLNNHCGLLVNVSRSIIYASNETDFAVNAAGKAKNLQQQMEQLLIDRNLL